MTITPQVDPDLLERARELDPRTSKNQLRKQLSIGWAKADQLADALVQERRQDARQRRVRMRQLARQKNPRRSAVIRSEVVLPSPPLVPVKAVSQGGANAAEGTSREPTSGSLKAPPSIDFGVADWAPSLSAYPLGPDLPPLGQTRLAKAVRRPSRRVATWPALIVGAPAAIAIWAGWVAIGKMTGFGKINLLPGIGKGWVVDTAITLPIGVEAYAAYAFYVALSLRAPKRARRFGAWSAGLAVLLGMGAQTAYHLMAVQQISLAPWQITTIVSCLPVGLFAAVAALVHMVNAGEEVTTR